MANWKVGHCIVKFNLETLKQIVLKQGTRKEKLMQQTGSKHNDELFNFFLMEEGEGDVHHVVKCNLDETDLVWNWALVWN